MPQSLFNAIMYSRPSPKNGAAFRRKKGVSYIEAFEDRFIPVTESGCWLWIGADYGNDDGYGRFCLGGRNQKAHRCSWQLYVGEIPSGMLVLHKCDTPGCVNPDHLYLGTHADNTRDKESRNRGNQAKGEDHGFAKLTEQDVIEIRKSSDSFTAIARRYGININTAWCAKTGKTWKHVSV